MNMLTQNNHGNPPLTPQRLSIGSSGSDNARAPHYLLQGSGNSGSDDGYGPMRMRLEEIKQKETEPKGDQSTAAVAGSSDDTDGVMEEQEQDDDNGEEDQQIDDEGSHGTEEEEEHQTDKIESDDNTVSSTGNDPSVDSNLVLDLLSCVVATKNISSGAYPVDSHILKGIHSLAEETIEDAASNDHIESLLEKATEMAKEKVCNTMVTAYAEAVADQEDLGRGIEAESVASSDEGFGDTRDEEVDYGYGDSSNEVERSHGANDEIALDRQVQVSFSISYFTGL